MSLPKVHPPVTNELSFGIWTISATKCHILCSEGVQRDAFVESLTLPNLPEMIFADNRLRIVHIDGFGIEFCALDALRRVDAQHGLVKVAGAQEWQQARANSEHINEVVNPFDWTFSTDYQGTLISNGDTRFQISETSEKIDIEKLKVHEKILFYADIMLFEDELADNGCSMLNVKIRVMPSSFFVLQRFFLRVDGVLVRINDTRIYHQAGTNFLLREYSSHESKMEELQATLEELNSELLTPTDDTDRPIAIIMMKLNDPNELINHLKETESTFQKLQFASTATMDHMDYWFQEGN